MDFKLHMILPHEGQADKWSDSAQERYHSILKKADSVEYVSREYYDGCMLDRNHRLVEYPLFAQADSTELRDHLPATEIRIYS